MQQRSRYRTLGWEHEHWELVRLFRSLRVADITAWRSQILANGEIDLGSGEALPVDKRAATLLHDYVVDASADRETALGALRDEREALAECSRLGLVAGRTRTRNAQHHQSAKALVAEVTELARRECAEANVGLDANPQRRAVWFSERGLHVCARNLDGAVPALLNPALVWEIKEYWGVTSGGSKMSDAVYECHLVGREIREYERKSGSRIVHAVFLDGRSQWNVRKSDIQRFIDLFHQGLIDHLMIGSQVAMEWLRVLKTSLRAPKPRIIP